MFAGSIWIRRKVPVWRLSKKKKAFHSIQTRLYPLPLRPSFWPFELSVFIVPAFLFKFAFSVPSLVWIVVVAVTFAGARWH
ncbi:hypothetical protein LENED_011149 [Lentinula edodes]|uniref:Uncharacterized protein n=1 Tax=Lentinula edodes TaxID=5353 RepID=A0A1Q3EPB6_LENED|nr:hypothetical protein LENED_011149 [Lentinula edodes]